MLQRDQEQVERALTRYLRGQRVGAIAADLGVSATTVRRWTHDALTTLAQDARANHATALARIIESQRAVASAAWEAYERERALDEALLRGDLDRVRRRAIRAPRRPRSPVAPDMAARPDCPPVPDEAEEEYERPKRSALGPSYLRLALNAQREVARLEDLYARLESSAPKASITIIKREPGPENQPPAGYTASVALDPPRASHAPGLPAGQDPR